MNQYGKVQKMTTDALISELAILFPKVWVRAGAEFDGGSAVLWSGEEAVMPDGLDAFDAEGDDGVYYICGVHRDLAAWSEKHRLYWEPYDSGTFLAYRADE